MPFNAELAEGRLSRERFIHYIVQDAHYLIGFGRALALAAAKARDPDRIVQFAKGAEVGDRGRALAARLLLRGIRHHTRDLRATPVQPASHHYVSYLTATRLRRA